MAIPFSEHEAVVLLDYYLKSLSGELTRQEAIRECSKMLRNMAIDSSSLDEGYRSIKGITYQIRCMESAYTNDIASPRPQLFRDTVHMYHNDYDRYMRMLREAKELSIMVNSPKKGTIEPYKSSTIDDRLLTFLAHEGLHFIDDREKNGYLWVLGGLEIFSKLLPLREYGIFFKFHTSGSDTPTGAAAWWTKDRIH